MQLRNHILCIAGFDPSAGAGILADIKTAENCDVYGLGVNTAITCQNHLQFYGIEWCSQDSIINQINSIVDAYSFDYYKIGIIQDFKVLKNIINHIKSKRPNAKCIWDPVLKASTGFTFNNNVSDDLEYILKNIYLITPNINEAKALFGENINAEYLQNMIISREWQTSILLKGGHLCSDDIVDTLITKSDINTFHGEKYQGLDKHGTGCVLSTAVCSFLTRGYSLIEACNKAKNYVQDFMKSNNTKLGYHNNK